MLITFYSYKGGTGRSMVLANLGYLLATDPMFSNPRVLLIDWDLEAPGLHRYFYPDFATALQLSPHTDDYERKLDESCGVIDYFWNVAGWYKRKFPEGDLAEKAALTAPAREAFQAFQAEHPLDKYILRADVPGSLGLLKAGAHRPSATPLLSSEGNRSAEFSYAERVRSFDWHHFYHAYGSFFTYLRAYLEQKFDFVLIDSRTGLTDTGGICTRVLPDRLVGVFAPNRQNLDGVQEVMRGAVNYRKRSRDARELLIYPLASRIDGNNSALRQTWWKGGMAGGERIIGYEETFERFFRDLYNLDQCDLESYFNATQIPHDADFAYGERLAVKTAVPTDKLSIGSACAALGRRIVANIAPWEVPDDQAALLEAAQKREKALRLEAEEARRRALAEANRRALVVGLLAFLVPGLWLIGLQWSPLSESEHMFLYLPVACWLGHKFGKDSLWPLLAGCVPLAAMRIVVGDVSTGADVGLLASAFVVHQLFSDQTYRAKCLSAARLPWRQLDFLFIALLTAAYSPVFVAVAFNVQFRNFFFLVLLLIGLSRIPLRALLGYVLVLGILATPLHILDSRMKHEYGKIAYEFWGVHSVLTGWLLLVGGRAIRQYVQCVYRTSPLFLRSQAIQATEASAIPGWIRLLRQSLPFLLVFAFADYYLFGGLRFESLPKELTIYFFDAPALLFIALALGFFYGARGVVYAGIAPLILVGLAAMWMGLAAYPAVTQTPGLTSGLLGGLRIPAGERGWITPMIGCVVLFVYAELGRRVGVWALSDSQQATNEVPTPRAASLARPA